MVSADIASVIRNNGAALHAYATRLTGGDRHLAEDVVQETWLRAWKHVDRLTEDHGSVHGWLRRIAHNVAIDQHRRRHARPAEVNVPEASLHNAAVLDDPADQIDTRIDVGHVLDTLSPAHRRTLVEVYFADRTATTAATTLGIPVGTAKSRIHNALNNLRTALEVTQTAA